MRILFTSSPGWGHIHPMVPLALAFRDRGDDVLWVTGSDATPRLEAEGIATAMAGISEREGMGALFARFPEVHEIPGPQKSDFMFPRLFGTIRAASMLADLTPIAAEWAPDLVVNDAAEFAGPVAAAQQGVASVSHSFGGLLPEPRVGSAGDAVAELWTGAGLEPRPYGGMYDHLYLDIYPPSLQSAERPHIPTTGLLQPGAFATSGDETLPDWVTAPSADPLVYVTFGTVFANNSALSAILDGLRQLDVRAVVTVGPHGDPESLGPQHANVHVARYVPQSQLLPHCAAVISHGGSGTFLAALAAELPQLCVPQAADQFFNAAAGARCGAALALQPEQVDASTVRDSVHRLLAEPRFGDAARKVSEEIDAMPSPKDIADLLVQRFGR
jgi:UDP:flavonoid glycosyltransferase YjiC (YdhE family)